MDRSLRGVTAAVAAALVAVGGSGLVTLPAAAASGATAASATPVAGRLTAKVAALGSLVTVPVAVDPLRIGDAASATSAAGAPPAGSGPITATTDVSVGIPGVLGSPGINATVVSADSATRTASADSGRGTATATQRLQGLDVLDGLVEVESFASACSITPSAATATATPTGVSVNGVPRTLVRGTPLVVDVGSARVTVGLVAGSTPPAPPTGPHTVTSDTLSIAVTGKVDVAGLLTLSDLQLAMSVGASRCTAPTPAAAVTRLGPASGPDGGGGVVTLTGSGFSGATGVTFGGVPATSFTVVDDATVTAVAPPHGAGAVAVVVTDPEGDGTAPGTYGYQATPPAVAAVTPVVGPDVGGSAVTVTGSGFLGVDGVRFGTTPATAVTVLSDTSLTAVAPPGPAGTAVDVSVTEPGQPTATRSAAFSWTPVAPELTSVSPVAGRDAGGTPVTLTGTGLLGVTTVLFGTTSATDVRVVSDTTVTATAPAGAAGSTVGVTVTEAGSAHLLAHAYSWLAGAPVAVSADPARGPDSGGTVVRVEGSGFTGVDAVTFGGVPGTGLSVVSDGVLLVTSPPGPVGTVPLAVAEGGAVAPVPGGFGYVGTPATLLSVTPPAGPDAGGTPVTLTGTGFTGATGVTFAGVPGSRLTVVSDTALTVTAPAGVTGPADVVVTDPGGDSGVALFGYLATPAVLSGVNPVSGPDAGGSPVTLVGSGFTGATAVSFDGVPGTGLHIVSDTRITVTTPPGLAGARDVRVQDPGGDVTWPATFRYLPGPALPTGLSPATGAETGGTAVTITGSGFTGTTGVTVGGVAATVTSITDTAITVQAPAGTAGTTVAVLVQDIGGDGVVPGGFHYLGHPAVVAGVSPDTGPDSGSTRVTVTGSGFTGATGVRFDGVPGSDLVVVSDTELLVTTPLGHPGTAAVVVTDTGGDGTRPAGFTYTGAAAVPTGLLPPAGPAGGGTVVELIGTGLAGVTDVLFGGIAGTDLVVHSDGRLTVRAPGGAAGAVDVQVVDAGGPATLPASYTYAGTPATVDHLVPAAGSEDGGTTVSLIGSGLTGALGVTFDGRPGGDLVVVDDGEVTVTTPPGVPGDADVVLLDDGGAVRLPGGFSYLGVAADPTGMSPADGPDAGGTRVRIAGAGLAHATGVTFDGVPGISPAPQPDGSLLVTTPPGRAGSTATVRVLDPSGDGDVPGGFSYAATPVRLDALPPLTGPDAGGSSVTLTGSGFTGVSAVRVDGVDVVFTVVDDAELILVTPPGARGPVTIEVVEGGVPVTVPFTYAGTPATVTGVSPATGPEAGGTVLTVTGSGFTGVTRVFVGDGPATVLPGASDGMLQVTTPPGPAGRTVALTVVDPTGNGDLRGAFTYAGVAAQLTDLSTATGPDAGGSLVTLTGTGLTGATAVLFGAAPATVLGSTDTELVVRAPAGPAGSTVDVTVSDAAGDGVLAAGWTWTGVPAVVTGLSTATGPDSGGSLVTVTGSGLTGVTEVLVGSTSVPVTVVSDTELTFTTPPGPAGPVTLRFEDPAGHGTVPFEIWAAPPVVGGLSPDSGPTGGGTAVTVTGTGFTGTTTVTVGGVPAVFDVLADDRLLVLVPGGPAGAADLVVRDVAGEGVGRFTYRAGAAVVSVLSVTTGPDSGGTVVTVRGTGLQGVTDAMVGGTAVAVTVVSDTELTFTTPSGSAGPVDLVLRDPAGDARVTFTYTGIPALLGALSPALGPDGGGTLVTITGSGLIGVSAVTFDGVPGTGVDVLDDGRLTVRTPMNTPGPATVQLVDVSGVDAGRLAAHTLAAAAAQGPDAAAAAVGESAGRSFDFVPAAASVHRVAPAEVSRLGGTEVSVTGDGFANAHAVWFGASRAPSFRVLSDTALVAVTPARADEDLDDVRVSDDAGDGLLTAAVIASFPSVVTSLAPDHGPVAGGTELTVHGTGFRGATGVTVGGRPAAFTVVSRRELRVVVPPGTAGAADVVVLDPAGPGTAVFSYLADEVAPGPVTSAPNPPGSGPSGSGPSGSGPSGSGPSGSGPSGSGSSGSGSSGSGTSDSGASSSGASRSAAAGAAGAAASPATGRGGSAGGAATEDAGAPGAEASGRAGTGDRAPAATGEGGTDEFLAVQPEVQAEPAGERWLGSPALTMTAATTTLTLAGLFPFAVRRRRCCGCDHRPCRDRDAVHACGCDWRVRSWLQRCARRALGRAPVEAHR